MIELTRLNGEAFVLNAELIETIVASPDTVVTLVNGHRYVVKESVDAVTEKVIQYKRRTKAF
jgi:flagellar protein FlbD